MSIIYFCSLLVLGLLLGKYFSEWFVTGIKPKISNLVLGIIAIVSAVAGFYIFKLYLITASQPFLVLAIVEWLGSILLLLAYIVGKQIEKEGVPKA